MVWPRRCWAPGTATAGAPPAIGEDGGGLGCFVPGPHRPPREDRHAVLLAESLREADMIELGLVGTRRLANWTKVNREARADRQKATVFKSSLMSEIIRFMFEPASCR